jgi:hypothetical protein
MIWTGQVACRNARCKILVVKSGGNNLFEGTEHRWDCNINICIKNCIVLVSTISLSLLVSDSFEHCSNSSMLSLH